MGLPSCARVGGCEGVSRVTDGTGARRGGRVATTAARMRRRATTLEPLEQRRLLSAALTGVQPPLPAQWFGLPLTLAGPAHRHEHTRAGRDADGSAGAATDISVSAAAPPTATTP